MLPGQPFDEHPVRPLDDVYPLGAVYPRPYSVWGA